MSYINGLGYPINMGLYYEVLNMQSNNLFINCAPYYLMIKFDNKIKLFNDYEDLKNYTMNNKVDLYTIVKTRNNDQYIYLYNKWNNIGKINKMNYIRIYKVETINKITTISPFMFFYLNDIKSNVKNIYNLLNVNANYVLLNKEMNIYYGMIGNYYINDIFFNILNINLKQGLTYLFKKLCNMYNISYINFNNFYDKVYKSLERIINITRSQYSSMNVDYDIDITQWINYISSCYSSYKNILINFYIYNINEPILNPDNDLKLIDNVLINRLKMNNNIKSDFLDMLQNINDIIYRNSEVNNEEYNEYNFYNELITIVNYFKGANSRFFSINENFENFLKILCNGVGGIINSAFTLAFISTGGNESKTQTYFRFILPGKYNDV